MRSIFPKLVSIDIPSVGGVHESVRGRVLTPDVITSDLLAFNEVIFR